MSSGARLELAEARRSESRTTANSLPDGVVNLALLLALGFLPGALHQRSAAVPVAYLALGAVYLLSRSLLPLWVATFAATLLLRLQPLDGWADQTFVQLSSLAALLSGHGIYDPNNGIGMSWSIYLPMANLLAAFPVWFLGAKFWNFFQVLVPAVLSLPFFVSPSQTTFRLFLGLVAFTPLAELTGRGNALELSVAVLFAGFWLLLRERHLPLAAALLAYGALLRQPLLFVVPFVALALWRLRARRALISFASVLVFGGLAHAARNPLGFVAATFGAWGDFADQWFDKLGAKGNYSISTLFVWLGDGGAIDRSRQSVYLLVLGLALAALAVAAWRGRSTEKAIACAIGATLLVHLLNRGFVHFHYLAAAAMPGLAFLGRETSEEFRCSGERRTAPLAERLLVGLVGASLVALVATPLLLAGWGKLFSGRPEVGQRVHIVSLHDGSRPVSWFLRRHDPPLTSVRLDARQPLRIELEEPTLPRELVLRGARIGPRLVDGVTMIYPNSTEVAGFLRSGRIEGSMDGVRWISLARFRTWVHPSFYPTRIALDSGGAPVRYLRVVDGATWWGQSAWLLGELEIRGDPVQPPDAPP